jgi:hypothetical protein
MALQPDAVMNASVKLLTPDADDMSVKDGVGHEPMSTYGAAWTGSPAAAEAGADNPSTAAPAASTAATIALNREDRIRSLP